MISLEQKLINVIFKMRKARGLTQSDIAKILQVSTSFVGNVENVNNPAKYNLRHMELVASHFKIEPHLLLIS